MSNIPAEDNGFVDRNAPAESDVAGRAPAYNAVSDSSTLARRVAAAEGALETRLRATFSDSDASSDTGASSDTTLH
jgi:hypothetical protein